MVSLLALVGFYGCTSVSGNQEGDKTLSENTSPAAAMPSDEDVKPEYLTYDTFIEKVWDFEKNPQE